MYSMCAIRVNLLSRQMHLHQLALNIIGGWVGSSGCCPIIIQPVWGWNFQSPITPLGKLVKATSWNNIIHRIHSDRFSKYIIRWFELVTLGIFVWGTNANLATIHSRSGEYNRRRHMSALNSFHLNITNRSTVPSTNTGTLGKDKQRRLWKNALVKIKKLLSLKTNNYTTTDIIIGPKTTKCCFNKMFRSSGKKHKPKPLKKHVRVCA